MPARQPPSRQPPARRPDGGPADSELGGAKLRLVDWLKRHAPATAEAAAAVLGVSATAARQHLGELEARGLAERTATAPAGPGRPPAQWSLTDLATGLFPDRHADLTLEVLDAIREASGEAGLEQVVEIRSRHQVERYREALAAGAELGERVGALARERTAEGYMAEVRADDDGSWLLVEHHCPICDAAAACQGLCRSELEVFRSALGPGATVEREQHLLAGDARCVYRVRPAG